MIRAFLSLYLRIESALIDFFASPRRRKNAWVWWVMWSTHFLFPALGTLVVVACLVAMTASELAAWLRIIAGVTAFVVACATCPTAFAVARLHRHSLQMRVLQRPVPDYGFMGGLVDLVGAASWVGGGAFLAVSLFSRFFGKPFALPYASLPSEGMAVTLGMGGTFLFVLGETVMTALVGGDGELRRRAAWMAVGWVCLTGGIILALYPGPWQRWGLLLLRHLPAPARVSLASSQWLQLLPAFASLVLAGVAMDRARAAVRRYRQHLQGRGG